MTMKTYPKCTVCRNADRRRLIEAGWNAGMGAETIARVLDERDIAGGAIMRHLKEHSEGDGNARLVEVEPDLPMRDRVYNIQKMQVDEIERRMAIAKTRADDMNRARENLTDAEGNPYPKVDWSDFYDILNKDAQAAIGSILKTQGLVDKREKAQGDLKLGLFEAMANAGLAPKAISGGRAPLQLTEGETDGTD